MSRRKFKSDRRVISVLILLFLVNLHTPLPAQDSVPDSERIRLLMEGFRSQRLSATSGRVKYEVIRYNYEPGKPDPTTPTYHWNISNCSRFAHSSSQLFLASD